MSPSNVPAPDAGARPGPVRAPADDADPDEARLRAAGRHPWAEVVSGVLHPAIVVSVLLAVVGVRAAGTSGLAWAVLAVVVCAGLPMAVVVAMARAGRLSGAQVVRRAERGVPAAVGLAAHLAGLALLVGLGAPRPVVALVVAMATGLVVISLVSLVMKASLHVAVTAGAVGVLAVELGPRAAAGALVLPLLAAWARVREGRHSVAQVAVGALIGAVVAGPVLAALR